MKIDRMVAAFLLCFVIATPVYALDTGAESLRLDCALGFAVSCFYPGGKQCWRSRDISNTHALWRQIAVWG